MNTELQIFNHPEFGDVRVIGDTENPRFCLADVCKVLEIGNASDVKRRLDDGVVSIEVITDSLGRTRCLLRKYVLTTNNIKKNSFDDIKLHHPIIDITKFKNIINKNIKKSSRHSSLSEIHIIIIRPITTSNAVISKHSFN